MITENPIILLVDDCTNDTLLMRLVFERAGLVQPLRFAVDGEDTIAYLQGDDRYRDRVLFPIPTVILLDLNMPKKNGFEVLAWIRLRPTFRRMCVFILSASNRPEDILRAYELGANSYLVKPGTLDGLTVMAKCLVAFFKLSHFAPALDFGAEGELAESEFAARFRSAGDRTG